MAWGNLLNRLRGSMGGFNQAPMQPTPPDMNTMRPGLPDNQITAAMPPGIMGSMGAPPINPMIGGMPSNSRGMPIPNSPTPNTPVPNTSRFGGLPPRTPQPFGAPPVPDRPMINTQRLNRGIRRNPQAIAANQFE